MCIFVHDVLPANRKVFRHPMNYKKVARDFVDVLGLSTPPIAISFCDKRPDSIPFFESTYPKPTADGRTGAVSAGCVFWVKSIDRTFATSPEDHANCSIGSLTHGFISLEEAGSRADVVAITEANWVDPEIFPDLPTVESRSSAIIYGPLSDSDRDPDVVFLRLIGKQVMQLHAAVPSLRFEGKPQCHIIAIAKELGEVAVSVGCMLSRVRTGIPTAEVTCAIPGRKVTEVIRALKQSRQADLLVASYASEDSRRF